MAPAPFRDPQENSNLLVQSTSVRETQFTFKADVKGRLNYQTEETTSELSHGTIQQQPAMQYCAGKEQLHGICFARAALPF